MDNQIPTEPDADIELSSEADAERLPAWDPWASADIMFACCGTSPAPPLFALDLGVLEDIVGHGQDDTQREVGGVLVGQFVLTPRGPLTRVDDIIIADSAEASRTHVTFTHESWDQIYRALEARDDDVRIVGWYHTHPGFGPFLSAQDMFIQRNFFDNPLHLALVLDPVQMIVAAFGWQGAEVIRSSGCYVFCAPERQAELEAFLKLLKYVEYRGKSLRERLLELVRHI